MTQRTVFVLMLTCLLAGPARALDATGPSIEARYGAIAKRIIDAASKQNDAWTKMKDLCDGIGARLSGSKQLEQAIDWAIARMKAEGHENVRRHKVMVPRWVRGNESLAMTSPRRVEMPILGLGGSVGTPKGGITAEVLVVRDEEELDAQKARVKGRIVVFDNAMPDYDAQAHGAGYGKTVRFRVHGARLAAEHGAVAALVRSVTAYSLHTPHTGGMQYGKAKNKIPAAAVTVEDATLMRRLQDRGVSMKLTLRMEAKTLPDSESANVIGELVGREKPEEVVILSGHLDSWDVGTGAHDDASGCVMAMEALSVLRRLGLQPRRTIRVVLWTNEENGLMGGITYAKDHAEQLKHHVAAVEADHGCFTPKGFSLEMDEHEASKRGLK